MLGIGNVSSKHLMIFHTQIERQTDRQTGRHPNTMPSSASLAKESSNRKHQVFDTQVNNKHSLRVFWFNELNSCSVMIQNFCVNKSKSPISAQQKSTSTYITFYSRKLFFQRYWPSSANVEASCTGWYNAGDQVSLGIKGQCRCQGPSNQVPISPEPSWYVVMENTQIVWSAYHLCTLMYIWLKLTKRGW